MSMKTLMLYGLIGGAAYWWFFMRQAPTLVAVPAAATPTTGAPGVQAFPLAPQQEIDAPNLYDLGAFPMGAFAK